MRKREPLPEDLDPLVTTHPASAAYRISNDCLGFTWAEQEAMARAVVALDRERNAWRADNGGGTMPWAFNAGREA